MLLYFKFFLFFSFLVYTLSEYILILDYKCSAKVLVLQICNFYFSGKTSLVSKNAPIMPCRIHKTLFQIPNTFFPTIAFCVFFFLRPYISYIFLISGLREKTTTNTTLLRSFFFYSDLSLHTVHKLNNLVYLTFSTAHSQQ